MNKKKSTVDLIYKKTGILAFSIGFRDVKLKCHSLSAIIITTI